MADPVGLTIGAVSLATAVSSVFVSTIECYQYVELGRHFGNDFDKSQARLAALKLQITRWGVSVGALCDPQTGTRRDVNVSAAKANAVRGLLTAIRDDTLEVIKKSHKYGGHQVPTEAGENNISVSGFADVMTTPTDQLMAQTNVIFAKRVRGVSWAKRTKWAFHEKKYFDKLLDDISENLGLLEKLLPQAEPSQQELCRTEVEEVQASASGDTPILPLLQYGSRANNDVLLERAIREATISSRPNHSWDRTEVDEDVTLEQGDYIAQGFTGQPPIERASHNFGVTIGRGRAKIRQGDSYGR